MYEVFVKLCERKNVRPADVAKATGIAPQTFSAWKQGQYSPKADKLQLIADYFGVTVDYLQTGEMTEGYYLDSQTAKIAQEIVESKEMALLFDAARDASPEDLQTTYQMLLALKRKERNYEEP